jgi:hypothetical protein
VTFGEMKAEVLRILAESGSSPVYFMESDVEEALNEGYEEISDSTEWLEEHETLSIRNRKTYYDLTTELASEILTLRRVYNNQTSAWMRHASYTDLDLYTYRRWEETIGEPHHVFTRGAWWMGIHPKQSADIGSLDVWFTAIPPRMTLDSESPAFPREFHWALVEFAVYDLLGQDGETRKALLHWAEYRKLEEALRRHVAGRVSMARTGVMGGR